MLLSDGQMSDHKGAAMILPSPADADVLIGDRGYDSDAFGAELNERGNTPCIPPRAKRKPARNHIPTQHIPEEADEGEKLKIAKTTRSDCAVVVWRVAPHLAA